MAKMARHREQEEIKAQSFEEVMLAFEVELHARVHVPWHVHGLIRAILDRVSPGVEETALKTEGILLVRALADSMAEDANEAHESAYQYWKTRLTGSIQLPARDGMPF